MSKKSRQQPQILQDARAAILLDYLRLRAGRPEHLADAGRDAERGLKAVRLAPTLQICRALLNGDRVHWRALDQEQAGRLGIRQGRRCRDGRHNLDDFNDVPAPR